MTQKKQHSRYLLDFILFSTVKVPLSKPFNTIRFIPTGGISQHNINDYLKVDSVLACGGSWMIDKENQETENYTQITEKVKEEIQRIQ